jgi:hypothetical protein
MQSKDILKLMTGGIPPATGLGLGLGVKKPKAADGKVMATKTGANGTEWKTPPAPKAANPLDPMPTAPKADWAIYLDDHGGTPAAAKSDLKAASSDVQKRYALTASLKLEEYNDLMAEWEVRNYSPEDLVAMKAKLAAAAAESKAAAIKKRAATIAAKKAAVPAEDEAPKKEKKKASPPEEEEVVVAPLPQKKKGRFSDEDILELSQRILPLINAYHDKVVTDVAKRIYDTFTSSLSVSSPLVVGKKAVVPAPAPAPAPKKKTKAKAPVPVPEPVPAAPPADVESSSEEEDDDEDEDDEDDETHSLSHNGVVVHERGYAAMMAVKKGGLSPVPVAVNEDEDE